MADEKEQGEECPSFVWKEPINGKTAFFTEEVYRKLAGPEPTVEERVTKLMDELGFPPPSKDSHRRKSSDRTNNLTNSEDSPTNSSHELVETPKKLESTVSSQGQLSSESEEKGTSDVDKNDSHIGSDNLSTIPTISTLSQENGIEQLEQKDVLESRVLENSTALQTDKGTAPQTEKSEAAATSYSASSSGLDKKLPGATVTSMKDVPSKPVIQSDAGFLSADKTGLQTKTMGKDGVSADGWKAKKMAKYQAKGQNKGKRPALPEAPKSSLTHDQHIRYLHLFQKCVQRYWSGLATPQSEHEINELKEFETLQLLVAKEQEACQSYLQQVSVLNPYLYTTMPPHVAQYTEEKEKNSWQRAETYCRYYNNNSGQLPLTVNMSQPHSAFPVLQLMRTLVEVGSKCKLVVPDLNPHHMNRQKPTVLTNGQKISARFPTVQPSEQPFWHHEPASKDSNLEILVRKHPCHIATSASVLQQLVDNHGPDFNVAWDIPVVVKEYGQGAGSRRVVFLDKPLRPSVLSLCQKKTQYLQKAVRAFLCHPQNERKLAAGRGKNSRDHSQSETTNSATVDASQSRAGNVQCDNEEDPFGSVNMEDLETFGSDKMFSSSSKKIPDIMSSFVKDGGSEVRPQTSESSVSNNSITSGSGLRNTGHQTENKMSENIIRTDSKSDTTLVKAEDSPDAKQNTDKNCSRSEAQSTLDNQLLSPKYCPGQLGTFDNDLSTDDEGALVIADQGTPVKASDTSTTSSHHMLRRSQDSKTSIFDDVPVPESPTPSKSPVWGQTSELPPRRVTRSASLKLSSPEANADKSSTPSFNQSSVSFENINTDFPETESVASAMTSPRLTRQSSKRKVSDCNVAAVEHEVVDTNCESLSSKKKRQIEASSIAGETKVSCSSGPGEGSEVPKMAVPFTPSSPDKQCQKKGQQNTETSTYFDSILKEMKTTAEHPGQQWQEDPSQYKQPGCVGDHVGYHQWDLAGITIIIRCNSHSFIRDMRQQQKAVYVRAKPERQLPHGLEQNTLSECVRSWLGCYLRPNSYLLRARVNMQNYELVQADELQLNQIPTLSFSPPCAFAVLQNIFAKLMDLPVGSYLLSHEPGASYVSLKTGTGAKRGGYDLRSHYMSLIMQEADTGVPWVPVDPTLMLPNHWRMGLIPATFQPPDFDPKRKKQQYVPPKKKHRNRRKKQN